MPSVPTSFTMQDVVNGVLNELRYAPGRDVQIHLQSSIIQDASMLYRTLMMKYRWRDFMYLTTVTIDATTGEPIEDLTAVLDRYSNILALYRDKEAQPLPFAPALINPTRYNRPCIMPSNTPNKIFSVWPHRASTCFLWSRKYRQIDFELDNEVPFYMDLLVLGTAYQLSVKSGVNLELTKAISQQFENLLNSYVDQEIKAQYQTNQYQGDIPMEWYSYDN